MTMGVADAAAEMVEVLAEVAVATMLVVVIKADADAARVVSVTVAPEDADEGTAMKEVATFANRADDVTTAEDAANDRDGTIVVDAVIDRDGMIAEDALRHVVIDRAEAEMIDHVEVVKATAREAGVGTTSVVGEIQNAVANAESHAVVTIKTQNGKRRKPPCELKRKPSLARS